jgi:hypothetical protein
MPLAGKGEIVVDAPAPPRSQQTVQALTPGSNKPMEISPDVQVNVGGGVPQQSELSDEDEMNQFFDYDLDDITGDDPEMKEVLQQIKATATTDMKPSRKLALAFTALADPKYARQMVSEHGAKKDRAQQTLMGLGTSVMGMRKEGKKQVMMADRASQAQAASFEKQAAGYVAKAEASALKQERDHNSGLVQERIKEMGDMRIPSSVLPPTDMTDGDAVNTWLIETQQQLSNGQQALETIELFENYVQSNDVMDGDAAMGAFRTIAAASGLGPDAIDDISEGYGPMIRARAKLAKQEFEQSERKINAQIAHMEANTQLFAGRLREMDQAIKIGDLKQLKDMGTVVKDLNNAALNADDQLSELENQAILLAQDYQAGTIDPQSFMSLSKDNARRREVMAPYADNLRRMGTHAQQRMAPYLKKMEFDQNYEQMFDKHVMNFMQQNPDLAADPAGVVEMLTAGPMEGPRQTFWYGLLGALKLEYPGMTLTEISGAVDEASAARLMEMQAMIAPTHEPQPQGAAPQGEPQGQPTEPVEPGAGRGLLKQAVGAGKSALGMDTRSRRAKDTE